MRSIYGKRKNYRMPQYLPSKEEIAAYNYCVRNDIRISPLGIKEDNLFPEPGEIRGIMAQMEALLELIEGNTKIQSNSEAA